MEESFDQKIIRNVQAGGFAVFKTPDVMGANTNIANIEWEDPEQVDKFFAFAKSLGAKVIYVAERDDEDEQGNTKTSIAQVGFLFDGIMHHINLEEPEEDEDDEDDDEYEEDDEEDYEEEDEQQTIPPQQSPQPQPTYQQPVSQPSPQPSMPQQQPSGQVPPSQPQWPRPQ